MKNNLIPLTGFWVSKNHFIQPPKNQLFSFFKIFLVFIFFSSTGFGQVSCYVFTESSGTYTALSSSTNIHTANWDDARTAVTIPFSFNFNSTNYTSCSVNTNGYLTFGSTASAAGGYTPISATTAYSGAISALGMNLNSTTGNIVYSTLGSTPNRVFVVQWTSAYRNTTSGPWNFQIRLSETSNKIDIVYGSSTVTNTTASNAEIGLRGASNSDYNNRSLTAASTWLNNTTRGTANTATVSTRNTSLPASGTTFSWQPTSSIATPVVTATLTTVCPGATTTLSATGNPDEASTLWFAAATCPTVGFIQEFQTMPYTTQETTLNSNNRGILTVTSANIPPPAVDPWISMETIFSTAIVPSVQKYVSMRYKITAGNGLYADVYFKKNGQILDENKRVEGALISDGNWHIVSIDMSVNSNWNNTGGNITGWRFDYTRGQNVTMQIDYIVMTSHPLLENTAADDTDIIITPIVDTAYYALRTAESTCSYSTPCGNSGTIYAGKTWIGTDGNWTAAGNWSPSGMPTSSHCVQASSGTIMVNGNGNAKNITLMGSSGLTIPSNNTLTVENEINTSSTTGIFVIQDGGSLVQKTEAVNTGTIKAIRIAKPMKRYDFTYWSSPVAAQNLYTLSPNTLWDKYYSYNPISGWVTHFNGATTMGIGIGYGVRAPQSFPINTTTVFTGNFIGVPNNGEIVVPGFKGSTTSEVWNLIGNPYPSAVNIDLFLTDPDNTEVGGTVYLWTHNSPPNTAVPGSTQYNYTSNDYASYNLSGSVATAATPDPNDSNTADNNYNTPIHGYIASGDGFFIRGIKNYEDLEAGNIPIKVKFKNSMRIVGNNANFFKPAPTTPVEDWATTGKHRFWINLYNDEGAFNQALIGYIENATDGLDRLYDGELFGGNYVTLYSIFDQTKLSIQGKALPFNDEDIVLLGYIATIAGNFTLSLDHFDGLFEGQDVFLKDKVLNVIHNLKEGAYGFASAIGTFEKRFEIVYKNETLGVENPIAKAESIIIYKNKASDVVVNAGLSIIEKVNVYDIAGRLLYESKKVNERETFIKKLPVGQQVLIVEVLTTDGIKMTKKIIF